MSDDPVRSLMEQWHAEVIEADRLSVNYIQTDLGAYHQGRRDSLRTVLAALAAADTGRVPVAWSEFGDGHDYSCTGKHDPNNCRHCLRTVLAAARETHQAR